MHKKSWKWPGIRWISHRGTIIWMCISHENLQRAEESDITFLNYWKELPTQNSVSRKNTAHKWRLNKDVFRWRRTNYLLPALKEFLKEVPHILCRNIIPEGNLEHQEWKNRGNSKYLGAYTSQAILFLWSSLKYVWWLKPKILTLNDRVFDVNWCNTSM